jgi:hypothetical protein
MSAALLEPKQKTVTSLRFELTAIRRDLSCIARPQAVLPTFSWKNLYIVRLGRKQLSNTHGWVSAAGASVQFEPRIASFQSTRRSRSQHIPLGYVARADKQ